MPKKTEKTYVTFGRIHVHVINGTTFDADCVAVISCANADHGRVMAMDLFQGEFSTTYHEDQFNMDSLKYFPRGLIEVK